MRTFRRDEELIRKSGALGLEHHLRTSHDHGMLRMVEKLLEIVDKPLADPSIVPLYLLSEFASQSTKVVLSGDGGDEIFAGYQTFQAHKLVTYYDVLRRFTKVVLRAMVSRLPVSHAYL